MELLSIYQPIKKELEWTEEELLSLVRKEFSPLFQPFIGYKGKKLRPALTLLSGKLFSDDLKTLIPLAVAVELFHTATLLHDDIVDNSQVRRGMPTINFLWGDKVALLLGDFLFSKAAELVSQSKNNRIISLLSQTLTTISMAELRQSLAPWEEKKSREHYYSWIKGKTASLFASAAETGAIWGQAPEEKIKDLREYGFNLGLSFQIVDDILDFTGQEEEMGKPIGSDLLQGHLTLPTIILLEKEAETPLKEAMETKNTEILKEIAQKIANSKSIIEESYDIARGFALKAIDALNDFPPSPILSSLINLAHYVIKRRY